VQCVELVLGKIRGVLTGGMRCHIPRFGLFLSYKIYDKGDKAMKVYLPLYDVGENQ